MKGLLLSILILVNILILFYTTTISKEYQVNYTTSDDQTVVMIGTIMVEPFKGDTINIRLIKVEGLEIVNVSGTLTNGAIELIGDEHIEGGYLYKHVGKLRGTIFINVGSNKTLFLIIREI